MHNGLFINGNWVSGKGRPFRSINPSSGQSIWESNSASASDVEAAVRSANSAFQDWRLTPFEKRVAFLEQFAEQLRAEQESLAKLIGKETTKPLWEARTEIAAMIGKIALSIEAYHIRTGRVEKDTAAGLSITCHRAHGVLVVLGPYNFPGHLPNGHIVPALLAGNTVVFKPSEHTPAVAEFMVKLWQQTGLPDGVLNLVQGSAEIGKALSSHPDVDGVLFTGSSATGHRLHQQFAGHPEKVLALEMGGNNPLLVDEIADAEAAVFNILFSSFVTAGQRCTCARRLLVPATERGDQLIAAVIENAKNLLVGRYDDKDQPFMGGVISEEAKEGLLNAQADLIALGASPLLTMEPHESGLTSLTPGILDVSGVSDLPDEEYFGPLLLVQRYKSFADAVQLANNTKYGLAAGLLSDSRDRFEAFLNLSRAGIVNWNKPLTGASSAAPFGGVGASGNHQPSAFYAADYCAYPVASLTGEGVAKPAQLPPGMNISNG